MSRYDVSNDIRTFQQIYFEFKIQGIKIDHFHCIDENGEVAHVNSECDWNSIHFNLEWLSETGNSPSNFKVTYNHSNGNPDTYAIKVVADEWHS